MKRANLSEDRQNTFTPLEIAEGNHVVSGKNVDSWKYVAAGFWAMGVLNNSVFVIMNAGAKSISASSVAVVYVCNVAPSFLVKGSAPFWFHLVSYRSRALASSILMSLSLIFVAFGTSLGEQLVGVAIGAFAGAMGESSFLAYTSRFDAATAITAWSSGTGFAGVFGYLWVMMFTRFLNTSFFMCLLAGNLLPLMYYLTFIMVLAPHSINKPVDNYEETDDDYELEPLKLNSGHTVESSSKIDIFGGGKDISCWKRFTLVFQLWQITIPLFVVYASEYALQSGTWAATGFPITSKAARDEFYLDSNLAYQIGVFLSRSSGLLFDFSIRGLWVLPILQFANLVFFSFNGIVHVWWNNSLLFLALFVGLLGGAVYVHGFKLISRHVLESQREVALSGASLADTAGILLGNMGGLVLQSCLYYVNNISDGVDPFYENGVEERSLFNCGMP